MKEYIKLLKLFIKLESIGGARKTYKEYHLDRFKGKLIGIQSQHEALHMWLRVYNNYRDNFSVSFEPSHISYHLSKLGELL